MPITGESQLYLLAAAFKFPKSGKQSKVSFCSLFSKQNPLPNSQIFSYLLGSLSDFNLFGFVKKGGTAQIEDLKDLKKVLKKSAKAYLNNSTEYILVQKLLNLIHTDEAR